MRYRHMMTKTTSDAQPSLVVCVDCLSARNRPELHDEKGQEKLIGWTAMPVATTGEERTGHFPSCGLTAGQFWSHLQILSRSSRSVMVVSYGCARIWGLLELWDRLEDGSVSLVGKDYRNPERRMSADKEVALSSNDPLSPVSGSAAQKIVSRRDGFLVCEDPPNIAKLRVGADGSWLTWIDLRNHVLEPPQHVTSDGAIAAWLAATVREMISRLRKESLGPLRATAGSQALSIYRRRFLDTGIYCHNHTGATRLERDSYHGGRCEAFRLGKIPGRAYHLDFRSMYGAIMRDTAVPVRLRDYMVNPRFTRVAEATKDGNGIADVTVETAEPAYPYIRDGLTVWPVGRFRATLAGPELADAYCRGAIRICHALATYDMEPALAEYAEHLHRLRLLYEREGNLTMATWCKRLLVSLPGKLGQRDHHWEHCPTVTPPMDYGEWYGQNRKGDIARYRCIAGVVSNDVSEGLAHDSQLAIASWITSAARMKLLAAIRIAGFHHVYYVDTDALIVDDDGMSRLSGTDLMGAETMGLLQVKRASDICDIRGVKYYVEDGRVTCAGLPRGVCRQIEGTDTFEVQSTPHEDIHAGRTPTVRTEQRRVAPDREYKHGTVQADGTITPFLITEDRP